jgi:hypothetical protein
LDVWKEGWTGRWIGGLVGELVDRRILRWTDASIDGWIETLIKRA